MFQTELILRKGAVILGLLLHNGDRIHLITAEEEGEPETEKRQFRVFGTGWPLDLWDQFTYIGSIFFGGSWHVFEDRTSGPTGTTVEENV